jgi:uncharacterized protein with PIN domain
VKFVADGMLGKLARWLRILGYDVTYYTNLDDFELEKIASKEQRTLLTKDLQLYRHAIAEGLDAYYVEGLVESERLAELVPRYGISLALDIERSRCPKCNGRIQSVSKENVAEKVEPNTFKHYEDFWQCQNCGQVYWQGSHWIKILALLGEAEKSARQVVSV